MHKLTSFSDRKIKDTIPDNRPPQVTFSCSATGPSSNTSLNYGTHPLLSTFGVSGLGSAVDETDEFGTCTFQFWVDRIESFYCKLDGCSWASKDNFDSNSTDYRCERIECSCIPGRFLCGEDGSVSTYHSTCSSCSKTQTDGHDYLDIDDFLVEEVRGPASFNCNNDGGCSFEEPAMNQLINDIFGDKAITLDCDSGECLHYTEVPGYKGGARKAGGHGRWIALSATLAGLIVIIAAIRELDISFDYVTGYR